MPSLFWAETTKVGFLGIWVKVLVGGSVADVKQPQAVFANKKKTLWSCYQPLPDLFLGLFVRTPLASYGAIRKKRWTPMASCRAEWVNLKACLAILLHSPVHMANNLILLNYIFLVYFSLFFYEWEHRRGTMCPFSSLYPLRKGRQWQQ